MAIFSRKTKRHAIKYAGNNAATIGAEHRWAVLLWMWRFVVVDARIVAELIGCSNKTATNKLRQIEQRELIQARSVHGKKIYWLTTQGSSEARGIARAYPDRIDIPFDGLPAKTEPSRWPAPGNIPHELLAQIYTIRIQKNLEGAKYKGTIKRIGCNRDFLAEDPYWSHIIDYRGRAIVPDAAIHWVDQEGANRFWFLELELDPSKDEKQRSRRIYQYSRMLRVHPGAIALFAFHKQSTLSLWRETKVYQYRYDDQMSGGRTHPTWKRVHDRGNDVEDDPPPDSLIFQLIPETLLSYLPDYRR